MLSAGDSWRRCSAVKDQQRTTEILGGPDPGAQNIDTAFTINMHLILVNSARSRYKNALLLLLGRVASEQSDL